MHLKKIALLMMLSSYNCFAVTVKSLTLIRADTGQVVAGYDPIAAKASIDLSKLPTRHVKIRANVDTATKSVLFKVDNTSTFISNVWPFSLCESGLPCPALAKGSHTVTAQPFTRTRARGKAGRVYKRTYTVSDVASQPPGTCTAARNLWLWTARAVLASTTEQDDLIRLGLQAKITDVHLFLVADDYVNRQAALQGFLRKLAAAGIRAWGLEGYRGYFSDAYGPSQFYRAIDALIAYNGRVAANERFVGFQGDLEPQDGQGSEFRTTFHNGLADSALSSQGGGVWQSSARLDRDYLMQDWLRIYTTASQKLHAAGLRLGAAMPSWTDDYYGEQVHVTVNGVRQSIMKQMMSVVDDYLVMSYNTNPNNASNRVLGEVTYADTLPVLARPKVSASVETHTGVGSGISYGDTAGKATRAAVLTDMGVIQSILAAHSSFCGVNIHDWVGWRDLAP